MKRAITPVSGGGGVPQCVRKLGSKEVSKKNSYSQILIYLPANFKNAFTLAEVMVVMLILSIILAAFAPMMTSRKKVDLASPWKYASNNSDAYYGLGNNQTALIGQRNTVTDYPSRLVIKTTSVSQNHILLKSSTGDNAILSLIGNSNLILGGKRKDIDKNTGAPNIAIGEGALEKNIGGYYNIAAGKNSLANNESGISNTAYGHLSVGTQTSSYNTGLGYKALGLQGCASGYNTAVGALAMAYDNACYQDAPKYNTAVGYSAIYSPHGGKYNAALGYNALPKVMGHNNTAIGSNACRNVEGSNKTCIGASSGPMSGSIAASSDDKQERIYIGSTSKFNGGAATLEIHNTTEQFNTGAFSGSPQFRNATSVVINGNLVVKGMLYSPMTDTNVTSSDGLVRFWRSTYHEAQDTHDTRLHDVVMALYSDSRLKNISTEYTEGLEQIRRLKPYNYTFKEDKNNTPKVGVIAQDLKKVFPNAVHKDVNGYYMIRQEEMFYALVNAVKQLDAIIIAVKKDIKELFDKTAGLDERVKAVETQNAELKAQNKMLQQQNADITARLNKLEKKLK